MSVKFIHTADWQIGKPYHSVEDDDKRSRLRQVRVDAIDNIRSILEADDEIAFVVVAGDLFESFMPASSDVSAVYRKIGSLKVPVYIIPGNHDYGGEESLWTRRFYIAEQEELAPNMSVLLTSEAVEREDCILLPCPLRRKNETDDPTSWLRSYKNDSPKPRIILAHGSVIGFDGGEQEASDIIHIDRLDRTQFDYLALGDWHGTKQWSDWVWYSGTHESDRFPKTQDYNSGNVLIVEASRGNAPEVEIRGTGLMNWISLEFTFQGEGYVESLGQFLAAQKADGSAENTALELSLSGYTGIAEHAKLAERKEALLSRLVWLKWRNAVSIQPTDEDLQSLADLLEAPLIRTLAEQLIEMKAKEEADQEIIDLALIELYLLKNK